jgi:hypothetical protein
LNGTACVTPGRIGSRYRLTVTYPVDHAYPPRQRLAFVVIPDN